MTQVVVVRFHSGLVKTCRVGEPLPAKLFLPDRPVTWDPATPLAPLRHRCFQLVRYSDDSAEYVEAHAVE